MSIQSLFREHGCRAYTISRHGFPNAIIVLYSSITLKGSKTQAVKGKFLEGKVDRIDLRPDMEISDIASFEREPFFDLVNMRIFQVPISSR